MGRSVQVQARERARAAKAKVDADRAERDEKLESLATDFYTGQVTIDNLLTQQAEARLDMARAVVALGDLGEPVDQVAALCGCTAAEVRALRKEASKSNPSKTTEGAASTDGEAE